MRFRYRLIITIALLIALSFGIGGTVLITVSFNTALEEQTGAALNSYMSVRNTLYLLNSLGEQTDYAGITQALEGLEGPWNALRVRLNGEELFHSGRDQLLSEKIPEPQPEQYGYMHIYDENGHGLQVASAIQMGEDCLLLEARFDTSDVYTARQVQLRLFFIIYIVVVLLGIAAASALSRVLTKHLDKLTRSARKISAGNLDIRSNIRTNDEFGQLSRSFDNMTDRLQENILRMESEMQRQEAFMGAFAHELKTPMTAIIVYADLLRQDGLPEDTKLTAADYIYSEGQRLEKLSFKLLDLLLLEKDEVVFKEVNLSAFLEDVEKALSPVLEKKNVKLVCRGVRGKVKLEPDLVKSLLYNLVDNAGKAMDGEGAIAVRGTLIPGGCEILVADNGRGMEEAELSRITEAFYRVDKSRSRQQGGAGLGLALCRRIVELHGGHIHFDSTPGSGTRVTVTLYERGGQNG